ncbi:MAG: hypothetical protein AAAFM81_13165 [Pseudomonadota bacterium]
MRPVLPIRPFSLIAAILLIIGCDTRVYVKEGVTDGNRFSLPAMVELSPDPVVQSWVAYSLAKSVCQLEMGGENPARNNSFACELSSREVLVDRWSDYGSVDTGERSDDAQYLDQLAEASDAGFLDEYVWQFMAQRDWTQPASLELEAFKRWRQEQPTWRRHRAVTRIIGSWGYPPGDEPN